MAPGPRFAPLGCRRMKKKKSDIKTAARVCGQVVNAMHESANKASTSDEVPEQEQQAEEPPAKGAQIKTSKPKSTSPWKKTVSKQCKNKVGPSGS